MFLTILGTFLGLLIVGGVAIWLVGERGRLYMPSTLKFIQAGGIKRFLSLSTLHGYIYMRWQKPYIRLFNNRVNPHASQPSRKWWSQLYHSKVLTEQQAQTIVTINEDIPYRDLEQIIPYRTARNIILSAHPNITVYECGCRHAKQHPCTPTQVCMFIGEPFASFMLEHHPTGTKALSQAEALSLLKSEHERGHVHTAWFKNAMHDRFYVICNCCKCCCGGIEQMKRYGVSFIASSGYMAKVNEALCAACGTCMDYCPFEALSVEDFSKVNWDKCMGCGVCVDQCPNGALSLELDQRKGVPLDAKDLLSQAI